MHKMQLWWPMLLPLCVHVWKACLKLLNLHMPRAQHIICLLTPYCTSSPPWSSCVGRSEMVIGWMLIIQLLFPVDTFVLYTLRCACAIWGSLVLPIYLYNPFSSLLWGADLDLCMLHICTWVSFHSCVRTECVSADCTHPAAKFLQWMLLY